MLPQYFLFALLATEPGVMSTARSFISSIELGVGHTNEVFGYIGLPQSSFTEEQCKQCECDRTSEITRFVILNSNYSKESVASESLDAFQNGSEATIAAVGCYDNYPIIRRVFSRN